MPLDVLVTRYASVGGGRLAAELNGLSGSFGRAESAAARAGRWNTALIGGSAAAAYGLMNLGKSALYAAGQQSRVLVGFETILKSKKAAAALQDEVLAFDIKSPFNYLESAQGAQMLLASGMNAKKLMETMYGVGNATVAAGGGTEKFNRALAVMAKIQSSGTLTKVRMNQFASAGIPAQAILKKQLGLTDEDMANIGQLHLKADVVIDALNTGFSEEFKGGLEKAAKSYIGSLETLEGTKGKLLMNIGHAIEADATRAVRGIIGLTEAVDGLVQRNPGLTRAAFAFGAVASVSGMIFGVVRALKMASMAHTLLARAVAVDTGAEATKTVVAGREAAAIAASGNAAAGAAAKVGLLSRANLLFRSPLALGGSSFATSAAFGGGRGALGALGSAGAQGGARSMGLVTTGGAALSLALGAGAGYQASGNMKAAGYSAAESNLYGTATGIGAAAVSMFVPGGAVFVAMGIAASGLANKILNEPMEKRALEGSGLDAKTEATQRDKTPDQRAADYDALAQKKLMEASRLQTRNVPFGYDSGRIHDLHQEAIIAHAEANVQRRVGRQIERNKLDWRRPEYQEEQRAQSLAWQEANRERITAMQQKNRRSLEAGGAVYPTGIISNQRVASGQTRQGRDGARSVSVTITGDLNIPSGDGEAVKRRMDYNTRTPSPSFL